MSSSAPDAAPTAAFLNHLHRLYASETAPPPESLLKRLALWPRRHRRTLLVLILLASPWLYRLAREKYTQSAFYRQRRQRHESFNMHLVKAEADQQRQAERSRFPPDRNKVAVDGIFLRKLHALMLIMIPHWKSKEMAMVLMHGGFLVLRTYLSVVVARLDGRIVKDLVGFNRGQWRFSNDA
jgi:hypothetical protein